MVVAYANQATMLAEVSPTGDTASKSRRFPVSCCNVADLEVQSYIIASVAERSNAGDCKSPGLRPTLVRIQPGAQTNLRAALPLFCSCAGRKTLSCLSSGFEVPQVMFLDLLERNIRGAVQETASIL